MCFSAEASFIASAGLAVIGRKCVKESTPSTKMIATIPLLFSLQQFAEGVNWVFEGGFDVPFVEPFFVTLYAWMEYCFWPGFCALCCYLDEARTSRRENYTLMLKILAGLGLLYSLIWSIYVLQKPITVAEYCYTGCGLNYDINFPKFYNESSLYVFLICMPTFFSRLFYMRLFGVLTGISFFISIWLFREAWGSTWCYFAAVLSTILYCAVREGRKQDLNPSSLVS